MLEESCDTKITESMYTKVHSANITTPFPTEPLPLCAAQLLSVALTLILRMFYALLHFLSISPTHKAQGSRRLVCFVHCCVRTIVGTTNTDLAFMF